MKINVFSVLEYLPSGIEVHPMGTPLVDDEEVSEEQIHIHALYLQSCPMKKCVRGTSFTSTESAMRNSLAQELLSMIYKMFTDSPREEPIKQVLNIDLECEALYTSFRTLYNQAVSSGKKNIRELYFDEVGYTSISGSRRPSIFTRAGSLKLKEIESMYQKLKQYNEYGVRNLSGW